MKFLIYDKDTGIVAKLIMVPEPSFLHLNNSDEDAFVQVEYTLMTFDENTKVIEANGIVHVEQDGQRVSVVVENGYTGLSYHGEEQNDLHDTGSDRVASIIGA